MGVSARNRNESDKEKENEACPNRNTPSLSTREQAPPPGLCAIRHARTLPHPLRECGGRDSAHSPFHSPLRPGCTPPHLNALARWAQGGQSVPPPFPFASRSLRLACVPSAARAPSPTLYANAGGGTVRAPPSVHPFARAAPTPPARPPPFA